MPKLSVPRLSLDESLPYPEILSKVQDYMAHNHSTLSKSEDLSAEDEFLYRRNVETYLQKNNIVSAEMSMSDLVARLYRDMKQYSILTPYLTAGKIEELGLEEIRVNSWESVYLITSKQGKIRLKEKFLSPTHAQDIISKLLRKSGMIMDSSSPYALGHIGKNQRIGAFLSPILDDEIGVSATIRIVAFSCLTRENLIEWRTATPDMLDFIEACLSHGVSLCIAGATGSGKTGTLGSMLSQLVQDDKKRLLTIEEGSREFDLILRDENGNVKNDVVHLLTHKSDDEKLNISQNVLLEQVLRHTPDILGIGEMRSVEAFTAIEASYTDHTIGTTTHAQNAVDAYERMVMLAAKGTSSFSEASLFRKAVKAFPIILYQQQLPDGTRRIMEIIEGLDFRDGKIIYNTLYRFKHKQTQYDNDIAVVIGEFERVNPISDGLRNRLSERGMTNEALERFTRRARL